MHQIIYFFKNLIALIKRRTGGDSKIKITAKKALELMSQGEPLNDLHILGEISLDDIKNYNTI